MGMVMNEGWSMMEFTGNGTLNISWFANFVMDNLLKRQLEPRAMLSITKRVARSMTYVSFYGGKDCC